MKDSCEYEEIRRYSVGEQQGCSVLGIILLVLGSFAGMILAYLLVAAIYAICQ